eukprot:s2032_g1.t1
MLKIGATRRLKACENDASAHYAEYIARFGEAFGRKEADGSLVEPEFPMSSGIPAIEPMHVHDDLEYEPSISSQDPLDEDDVPDCPPDDEVVFDDDDSTSEGVTSGIAVTASIASDAASLLPQERVQEMFQGCFAAAATIEFSQAVKEPKGNQEKHKLVGNDVLFEFACDKDSNLGSVGAEHGVKVICLCKEDIDLECPESIEQLIAQVKGLPGCSIHCSIECKPWSQWHSLSERKYPRLSACIRKERENSEKLLKQFIRVGNICLDDGLVPVGLSHGFCSGWVLHVCKNGFLRGICTLQHLMGVLLEPKQMESQPESHGVSFLLQVDLLKA